MRTFWFIMLLIWFFEIPNSSSKVEMHFANDLGPRSAFPIISSPTVYLTGLFSSWSRPFVVSWPWTVFMEPSSPLGGIGTQFPHLFSYRLVPIWGPKSVTLYYSLFKNGGSVGAGLEGVEEHSSASTVVSASTVHQTSIFGLPPTIFHWKPQWFLTYWVDYKFIKLSKTISLTPC